MRVQIPAYTDRWMMGDRFGTVIKTFQVLVDNQSIDRLRVKLDKSSKVVTVIANDCTILQEYSNSPLWRV